MNTQTIFKTISKSIANDTKGFIHLFHTETALDSGLYTYPIKKPNGKTVRVHLRIDQSGSGILFIDVTDVFHLNSMGIKIAKMALDEIPIKSAFNYLLRNYSVNSKSIIDSDVEKIYGLISHVKEYNDGCLTCSIVDDFIMSDLFSLPINAPFKVDMALTYGCNNECPHCYNEADRLSMPSLPLGDWYEVIDKIYSIGVPHLILTGGEATLYPELPEIINYADSKGMVVGLNTNGRHIAHKPYLEKIINAGINHIQITLGSHIPEVHNAMMGTESFSQTVKGIQTAVEEKVHVITNTTLMRTNMNHIEDTIDFLYDLGIRTFAMNGMIYSGGGFEHPTAIPEDEMSPLLVRVRDHSRDLGMRFLWYTPTEYCRLSPIELEIGAKRCNAGEYSLCIEPNGDVLPCQSYYVSAGNILNDPWENIWQSELFQSFRNREDDPKLAGLPEKCWTCPDISLCGGGCRIEREARDGIRIAGDSGGGCSGCSGSCGTGPASMMVKGHSHTSGYIPNGGYVPNSSQTDNKVRSTGNMPFISIDKLKD